MSSSTSKVKPFNTLKSDHKKLLGKKTIPKELFHGTFWRERQRTEEEETKILRGGGGGVRREEGARREEVGRREDVVRREEGGEREEGVGRREDRVEKLEGRREEVRNIRREETRSKDFRGYKNDYEFFRKEEGGKKEGGRREEVGGGLKREEGGGKREEERREDVEKLERDVRWKEEKIRGLTEENEEKEKKMGEMKRNLKELMEIVKEKERQIDKAKEIQTNISQTKWGNNGEGKDLTNQKLVDYALFLENQLERAEKLEQKIKESVFLLVFLYINFLLIKYQ